VRPFGDCVFKPMLNTGAAGLLEIGVNVAFLQSDCKLDKAVAAHFNCRPRRAAERMVKVFLMKGGTSGTPSVQGAFATTSVAMAESREKLELKCMNGTAISTETMTNSLLKMVPGDVVINERGQSSVSTRYSQVERSIIRWSRKAQLWPG
jgi:hypothetical protein